jgi:hypothetical protein
MGKGKQAGTACAWTDSDVMLGWFGGAVKSLEKEFGSRGG